MVSDMSLFLKPLQSLKCSSYARRSSTDRQRLRHITAKHSTFRQDFSIINKAEDAVDGRVNLLACFDEEVKVELGQPTKESGESALKALDKAMTDFRSQLYDVLVACPVSLSNMTANEVGYTYNGLKEYAETCIGDGAKGMKIMVNESLRIALATNGLAIKDVPANITEENILNKIS